MTRDERSAVVPAAEMEPARRAAYARLRTAIEASAAMTPSGRPTADCAPVTVAPLMSDPTVRDRAMQRFVELAWRELGPTGVSWLGFYVEVPGAPEHERLVLAAREPKPACSPIGLHGACGQCLLAAKPLVVRDVADLGAGYIACDPRDRSEVVVPCLDPHGRAWAVLDLDSHALGSFTTADASELVALLRLVHLTSGSPPAALP